MPTLLAVSATFNVPSAAATPSSPPPRPSATIWIDGLTSDWEAAGIPPIILDGEGDVVIDDTTTDAYDDVDVKAVYMTHDSYNLYIRIDVNGTATRTGGDYTILLDTDQNPETGYWSGYVGWEYVVNIWGGYAFLRKANPKSPYWLDMVNPRLRFAMRDHTIEVAVPLRDIGYAEAVNFLVLANPCDISSYGYSAYTITYRIGTHHMDNFVEDNDFSDWRDAGIPYAFRDIDYAPPPPEGVDIDYIYIADDATPDSLGHLFVCVNMTGDYTSADYLDLMVFVDEDRNTGTGRPYPWMGAEWIDGRFDKAGYKVLEMSIGPGFSLNQYVRVFVVTGIYEYHWDGGWPEGDYVPEFGVASYPYARVRSAWLENPVTLDGEMSSGEWDEATPTYMVFRNESIGPELYYAKVWMKNDARWLYIFMNVSYPLPLGCGEIVWWDELFDLGGINYYSGAKDLCWHEGGFANDIDAGGELNVEGAATYDAAHECYYFEFRKELDSLDGCDFSFVPGHSYGCFVDEYLLLDIYDPWMDKYWGDYARVDLALCPWLVGPIDAIHEEDIEPNYPYEDWTGYEGFLKADTCVGYNTTEPIRIDIAKYSGNPTHYSLTGDLGKYVDVRINRTDGIDHLTILVWYTDDEVAAVGMPETYLRLYWWDEWARTWRLCSDTWVYTEDETVGDMEYSGHVGAWISTDTYPSLDDLAYTAFCIRAHTPPHPYIYSIHLTPGWNLISAPIVPEDSSLTTILEPVKYNVTEIWTYDARYKRWLWAKISVYYGRIYIYGTLRNLEAGKGYWVKANDECFLPIEGYEILPKEVPPTYPVYKGWNLIGFKSINSMPAEDYLASLDLNTVKAIIKFDPYTGKYYTIGLSAEMEPGYGYWLYVTEDGTIEPPIPT